MEVNFKDLDTDENGTLDQKEILESMKKQAGRDRWTNGTTCAPCYGIGFSLHLFDLPMLINTQFDDF